MTTMLFSVILGIIIGYLLKGDLRNMDVSNLKGIYIAFASFLVEVILFTLVRKGILERGLITIIIYSIQYLLLFIFVYLNRKNFAILILGLGFLLNAIAIFSNGGAMPVNPNAIVEAGLAPSIDQINASSEGLYIVADETTKLAIFGDFIPIKYVLHYVISIGDILIYLGILLYIIKEMKRNPA
ncbi:hypothetical protein ABG79_00593 [Caloramator mitchellensis]|uniref:DUF5317 domain-containing protein n=1 Tax=Caloramator mitchellensis TaxID=908809 RepID=A0A0R3K380_CALMK|nr:DUF5317 domain-containing protein [Caloramator mitchellensis]KRQ87788.1 hypothetical protein ABG79_00593 [Caloramator mitchellensis]